jgi:hypothetical protein
MLALLRPGSWDFPLFLHVLGATVLFGGIFAVAVLSFTASGRSDPATLGRSAFRVWLFVVVPAFVLTRAGAQWILDREKHAITGLDKKGWVGVGLAVTDFGLVVLLALGVAAWLGSRKADATRARAATGVLSAVYLVALAVAWFAMSAKPGA